MLEDDPLIGESGECWSLGVFVPIWFQMVRPRRIEGDEENRRTTGCEGADTNYRIFRFASRTANEAYEA